MPSELPPKVAESWDAFNRLGNKSAAARELGIPRATLQSRLEKAQRLLGLSAQAPNTGPAEHSTYARTVQYDGAGNVIQEWRKMSPEYQAFEALCDRLCKKVKGEGRVQHRRTKKTDSKNTLFEFDLFDAHMGMFASRAYTRDANYDCKIATRTMIDAAETLASRAQRPQMSVVTLGGDMMHTDNRSNKTEHAKNNLDVDTRFNRIVDFLVAACTDVVDVVSAVSRETLIVVCPGNHDWHSSIWLSRLLSAYYNKCPNVTVLSQDSPRKFFRWGVNGLWWSHGQRVSKVKWPQIIAAEFPKEWAATTFRHLKLGHFHHKVSLPPISIEDQQGLLVEYLESICPVDAWHAEAGFVGSKKGASAFEYHKKHGLSCRYYYHT